MTLEEYNAYDEGEVVTLSMSFTDRGGAPVSPTTILVQLRDPVTREITEFAETALEMVEDAEGEWHIDVETRNFHEGVWAYKVYAEGDSASAREWAFIIKVSELT